MITQSINLNLIPGAVPPRIKVSQYDFGSRTLQFTLFNGTSPFTTASLTARIQGTKPDNKGFSYDATYSAGVVTADVTRQMTACAGAVTCELVIVDGSNNELGTGNFILDVEAAALSEDTDISETEIPAIIDAAEANAERAEAAAAIAEAADLHPPYIGENEHWYVWDTVQEQYADSGVDAEGVDGVGIVSIAKTSTVGLVDTYTITLSNGNTSTFTVTNGAAAVLPAGGTEGQALIKNSSTDSDASWKFPRDYETMAATGAAEGAGLNLLPIGASTNTKKDVTCTINADKSVTLSGAASGSDEFVLFEGGIDIPESIFSIGVLKHASTNAIVRIGTTEYLIPADKPFVELPAGNLNLCKIFFNQYFSPTSGVTYYPMVYPKYVVNPSFRQYVPSVMKCIDGYTVSGTNSASEKARNVLGLSFPVQMKLEVFAANGAGYGVGTVYRATAADIPTVTMLATSGLTFAKNAAGTIQALMNNAAVTSVYRYTKI